MKTSQAASPSVTAADIWISLTVFVLLYAALGVADAYLMVHYGRKDLGAGTGPGGGEAGDGDGGGAAGDDRQRPDGSTSDEAASDEAASDEAEGDRVPALIY